MIHKFIYNNTKILFDVHSGSLHIVDDLVWDLLDDFDSFDETLSNKLAGKYSAKDIDEAREEIKDLVRQGVLFSTDPLKGQYTPLKENVVKALCLHLAHDCNLACSYCFAAQGKFGSDPDLMTLEVGIKSLEFLMNSSGPRHNVEVDFFGGEPLLNFDVLRILVEYGRKLARERGKEIKYTVTTNAVLLNRKVGDFLNSNNISVVLSIDGRPDVHNNMRPFPNGKGSYEVVLKNIKSFLLSRDFKDYYVRGTYTAFNPDFAKDLEHLADQGFNNISLEPVVADKCEHYALSEGMLQNIANEYDKLTSLILKLKEQGRAVNFFHFNVDLNGGPCLPKRMNGCGAGYQYLAVDPKGNMYPCHQFVGQESFLIGDVYTGIHRADLVEHFKNMHLYRKNGCGQCWVKFFCSGGCHANAYKYSGSMETPYSPGCFLIKKRLECALYLYMLNNSASNF